MNPDLCPSLNLSPIMHFAPILDPDDRLGELAGLFPLGRADGLIDVPGGLFAEGGVGVGAEFTQAQAEAAFVGVVGPDVVLKGRDGFQRLDLFPGVR